MTQLPLYSVEREFPFPTPEVWSAWTDPAKLEMWYHPTDLTSLLGLTESEARVGGPWAVTVDVPEHGFVAYFYGVYTDVQDMARLEYTMMYTQSAAEFEAKDLAAPAHNVVIDFDNRDGSTFVRFSQFGELPEGQAAQAKAGMESYFDSLGIFLGDEPTD